MPPASFTCAAMALCVLQRGVGVQVESWAAAYKVLAVPSRALKLVLLASRVRAAILAQII